MHCSRLDTCFLVSMPHLWRHCGQDTLLALPFFFLSLFLSFVDGAAINIGLQMPWLFLELPHSVHKCFYEPTVCNAGRPDTNTTCMLDRCSWTEMGTSGRTYLLSTFPLCITGYTFLLLSPHCPPSLSRL